MTNKTFEPVGLLEITKQLADSAQAHVDRGRKQVADLEDRLHSVLDAKRDVASDYAKQLDFAMKRNESLWKDGYRVGLENGERKGYDEGYKAGRESEMKQQIDSMTLDEVSQELVSGGISVEDQDQLVDDVEKIIADHETGSTTSHEQDIDEDEPDQYQPEPEKWGGTK